MKSIANAIVYAVAYIEVAEHNDTKRFDDDVGALESIAAKLRDATRDELAALADAAERALDREMKLPQPRSRFVEVYSTWMENVVGDGWKGNKRI